MKTSEKIVAGELLLIGGLGMIAFGKSMMLLNDRVTKLEKQQENLNKILRITTKEKIDRINKEINNAIKHS